MLKNLNFSKDNIDNMDNIYQSLDVSDYRNLSYLNWKIDDIFTTFLISIIKDECLNLVDRKSVDSELCYSYNIDNTLKINIINLKLNKHLKKYNSIVTIYKHRHQIVINLNIVKTLNEK
jgi:hypothetical protein